ncbi:MAG: hypothetical protein GXO68_01650 [Crenarchaeota archaeon]|nr:hypothetical protein [Thermoproteota archaeon]
MKIPCPRCGRQVDFLVGRVCSSCFAETYGLADIPSTAEATICRYCGSIRIGGRWIHVRSFDEAIGTLAAYLVEKAKPVEPIERVVLVSIDYETLPNWSTRVKLSLKGVYRGRSIQGYQSITVRLRPSICPLCKTRISGEYDTVLQIRGADSEYLEKLVESVLRKLEIYEQVVDIIPGKNGLDVYFTNAGAARKVAKELAKITGGKITVPEYEYVGIDSSGRRRTRKTLVLRVGGGQKDITGER